MTIHRRTFLAQSAAMGTFLTCGSVPSPVHAETPAANHDANPFLHGIYAPVQEEIQADNLTIVGKIPAELDGMFVRNGPNPQFLPKGPYHWFDGDGMLHGVRIRDGRASYRNRYVRTQGWLEEHRAGKSLSDGLLCQPNYLRIARGEDGYKNAANTALVWHNQRLLALWEGGAPHQIHIPDLETVGRYTFNNRLKHNFTAHPKIDPATGEMIFFGYQPTRPYLQTSIANARGEIVRTIGIDLPHPVMMHDFGITPNYSIFLDFPVIFSFERLLRGEPVFGFEPEKGARIGVIPRHGKSNEIRWFPVETGYVFHVLNAHEEVEGEEQIVVLRACRMKEFPKELEPPERIGPDRRKKLAVLHQWRMNLQTGQVHEMPLDDVPSDFPRIQDSLTGKPIRHGYTLRLTQDGFIKYDLKTNRSETHLLGKGRFGGEGVFVPRPESKNDADGWLMSYINDSNTGKSELRIIDCRDFTAEPIARVLLPQRVPYGFHGLWLTGQQLQQNQPGI